MLIFLKLFISLFLNNLLAVAKINQPCYVCHTMHYSQGGKSPDSSVVENFTNTNFYSNPFDIAWDRKGPYKTLVIGDCFYCHTRQKNGQSNWFIPNINGDNYGETGTESPATGRNTLAGGSFYWVTTLKKDECGHNVLETGANLPDKYLNSYTPPGWDIKATNVLSWVGQVAFPDEESGKWSYPLTCAGTYGCHGRHGNFTTGILDSFSGIKGAHHSNVDGYCDGSTLGNSYRFLAGIKGIEDKDWEYTVSPQDHNVYYGIDGNNNYQNTHTISYLCAECHGIFHADIGSSSPWFRHPSDFDMNNVKGNIQNPNEYYYYPDPEKNNIHIYNPVAPVAFDIDLLGENYDFSQVLNKQGDAIVNCLSCHRAHGSPYSKILRWDWTSQDLSKALYGCSRCHTSKY